MSLFDSAKSAGGSAFKVAQTFGKNVRAEAQPKDHNSYVELGKDVAQGVGRAAVKTYQDDSFAAAKHDATQLVSELRQQLEEKKRRLGLGGNVQEPPKDENIVDGEVLSVEFKPGKE